MQQANTFLCMLFQQVHTISKLTQYSMILAHGPTAFPYFKQVKESALLPAPSKLLLCLVKKIQDFLQQEQIALSAGSLTLACTIAALRGRALASAQTTLAASASRELSAAHFTKVDVLWCKCLIGVAGSAWLCNDCVYNDTQANSGCAFDVGTCPSSCQPATLCSPLPALLYNLLASHQPANLHLHPPALRTTCLRSPCASHQSQSDNLTL